MKSISALVPLDVPAAKRSIYLANLRRLTRGSGRLLLFAGDQRVEHLNDDFFGTGIPADSANPEHLFKIASSSRIGGFATQLGLIARYGASYPKVPYIVKLNSKTNLIKEASQDPYSPAWYDVRQVVDFAKKSKLDIPAVGYTVYIGSTFEPAMLHEAAQIVYQAHQEGLVAILWLYPRGQSVTDIYDAHLIAGAVNVGAALGADFIKVNRPSPASPQSLQEIISAAGRSSVLFAGGEAMSSEDLLNSVYLQVNRFGAAGAALGRNLHQHPLAEAVALANALAAIIYEGQSPEAAIRSIVKR